MTPRLGDSDLIYHGYRDRSSGHVIVLESPGGTPLGVLAHVVRHSPSGFGWGYHGSGPCDTALSLLVDALGDAAACPACRGTGRVVYVTGNARTHAEPFDRSRHPWAVHGWACECSGGYRHLPYADFAGEFAAQWGEEWRDEPGQYLVLAGGARAGRQLIPRPSQAGPRG